MWTPGITLDDNAAEYTRFKECEHIISIVYFSPRSDFSFRLLLIPEQLSKEWPEIQLKDALDWGRETENNWPWGVCWVWKGLSIDAVVAPLPLPEDDGAGTTKQTRKQPFLLNHVYVSVASSFTVFISVVSYESSR